MTIANWFLNWMFGSESGAPSGDQYLLLEDTFRFTLEDGSGFLKLE